VAAYCSRVVDTLNRDYAKVLAENINKVIKARKTHIQPGSAVTQS